MREIKFRAWDKEKKIWVSNGEIEFSLSEGTMVVCPNTVEHIGDSVHDMYVADRFDIQQSTGLLDRNGVEIYEGDILMRQHNRRTITVASLKDGRYSAFWDFSDFLDPADDYFGCEVIGNIYEHGNLLEEVI